MANSWQEPYYSPIGGLNSEDSDDAVGDGEVVASTNILYYANQTITRPGLNQLNVTGLAEGCQFGFGAYLGDVPPPNAVPPPFMILIGNSNKIYYVNLNGAATEMTPAAASAAFQQKQQHNVALVNGVYLFGNNPGGLVRWDPYTAGNYTVMSQAMYRYVTGHFTRAVAAFQLNSTMRLGPHVVAWSKPGDETVWNTPGGTDGSGNTTLTDLPDDITGLANLQNLVVICRRFGFHLGAPTGQATAPFDFKAWSYKDVGVFWPGTQAVCSNLLFFVGEDDVYTFDLQRTDPIGYNIRSQLIADLTGNYTFSGFISRRFKNAKPRYCYNLMSTNMAAPGKHYVYDILERKWSIHTYTSKQPSWGFSRFSSTGLDGGICFVDNQNPPHIFTWDNNVACESAASITGPIQTILSESQEAAIQRILVKARDYGNGANVTVTLTAKQAQVPVSKAETKAIGNNSNDSRWTATWFDIRLSGQFFQVKIDIPANQKFATNKWMLETGGDGPRFRA